MSQTKYYDLMEHVIIVHQINNHQHQRENVRTLKYICVKGPKQSLTIGDSAKIVIVMKHQTKILESVSHHRVIQEKL